MLKKLLRVGAVSLTSLAMTFGLSGAASAASISLTGPGSTNIISGGYSGSSSIHYTGPGSTNIIRSGYDSHKYNNDHKNDNHKYKPAVYKQSDHKKHHDDKKCEKRSMYNKDHECCDRYSGNNWYSKSNYDNKCKDHDYKDKGCNVCKSHDWCGNHWYKPVVFHKDYDHKKSYVKHDYDKKDHDYDKKRDYDKKGNNHYGGNTHAVSNTNNVNVDNNVSQRAYTGDAKVYGNTFGGNATSGDASNESEISTNVTINNDNDGSSSSANSGKFHYGGNRSSVENDNDVDVSNNVSQYAKSGDATVAHNTKGGNATSGNASNESSISTVVTINN